MGGIKERKKKRMLSKVTGTFGGKRVTERECEGKGDGLLSSYVVATAKTAPAAAVPKAQGTRTTRSPWEGGARSQK